jgi:hypothetical protein
MPILINSFQLSYHSCSRYSDSIRAGRFGVRKQVGEIFSLTVQTSSGAHPTSCTMGTGVLSQR